VLIAVIVGPGISSVKKEVTICAGAKTVDALIVDVRVTVGPAIWTILVETIVEAGKTLVETDTGKVLVDKIVVGGRDFVTTAVEVL
jgi:hypothetical protein